MRAGKGLLAGFIATVVLSGVMILKAFAHRLPALNVIEMIHSLTGGPLVMGWIGHFVIGTLVWGILFALLYGALPGRNGLMKGLAFGVFAWAAMMLLFFPVVGAGFFGVAIGWPAILVTLILHLIYGGVLGTTYAVMT